MFSKVITPALLFLLATALPMPVYSYGGFETSEPACLINPEGDGSRVEESVAGGYPDRAFAAAPPSLQQVGLPELPARPLAYRPVPYFSRRPVQAALPVLAGGLLLMGNDTRFRDLRNDYLEGTRYHLDDYVQYSPAAILLGLKVFGVEGRSGWGRMLVSDAFSVVGTVIFVNGTKLLRLRERPNGTNRRSFPSGHTATAFMTATMLHKEYGTTISPLISIGGYALAAFTGVSRSLNNMHWPSDILTGAAIGVLTTELGYYIGDLIYRDRQLKRPLLSMPGPGNEGKPSFLGISLSSNLLPSYDSKALLRNSGVSASLDGAYFLTPRWGVGGQFAVGGNRNLYLERIIANNPDLDADPGDAGNVNYITLHGGAYFSHPVGKRWLFMGKLLGGPAWPLKHTTTIPVRGNSVPDFIYTTPDGPYLSFTAGASISFIANNNFALRFFAEVRNIRQGNGDKSGGNGYGAGNSAFYPLTLGFSFDAMLW